MSSGQNKQEVSPLSPEEGESSEGNYLLYAQSLNVTSSLDFSFIYRNICLLVCVSMHHVSVYCHRKASDPLERQLQTAVNLMWVLGTDPMSSA